MSSSAVLYLSLACAACGLAVAGFFRWRLLLLPEGNEAMRTVSSQIRKGAQAFLWREYGTVSGFIAIAAIFLIFLLPQQSLFTALCFLCGAIASLLAGFIGMSTAILANVRTTEAARSSLVKAFRVAFLSSTTLGLSVVGLGLLGLTMTILTFHAYTELTLADILQALVGYAFGASSVALFARVGGGIFAKAADVGADLAGKAEAGLSEDNQRNPAVIADMVGDNVGDVAGLGADLFESFVGSIIAAMLIGWETVGTEQAVLFPLALASLGILCSIAGSFIVRMGSEAISSALRRGIILTSVLIAVLGYFLTKAFFIEQGMQMGMYISLLIGLAVGVSIGLFTEYYTSENDDPVQQLAESSRSGAATSVIAGLSLGYFSTIFPILLIVLGAGAAFLLNNGGSGTGLYGIATTAVGMLSTLGITLAAEAYGPVADNAGGIAEMSHLPDEVRSTIDQLDSAGHRFAAIGKGFAIGSAAFTALTLFSVFCIQTKLESIDLQEPMVLIGLFIGGALPFLFTALTMHAIGQTAQALMNEVRRQFRETPNLLKGKAKSDPAQCISLSTAAALQEMFAPGLLAILSPLLVGFALGLQALAGMLVGALITGVLLAISMVISGAAWDAAKRLIEGGACGGSGSDTHRAAIVGDTVGDSFKNAAGPSLNTLIKLMMIVAILTVSLFSANGLAGIVS